MLRESPVYASLNTRRRPWPDHETSRVCTCLRFYPLICTQEWSSDLLIHGYPYYFEEEELSRWTMMSATSRNPTVVHGRVWQLINPYPESYDDLLPIQDSGNRRQYVGDLALTARASLRCRGRTIVYTCILDLSSLFGIMRVNQMVVHVLELITSY